MRRRNRNALIFFFCFYVGFGALLAWQQERVIYQPSGPGFGECSHLSTAQTRQHGSARLYYHNAGPNAPLAVLYHGNGGSACDRGAYLAPLLQTAGYSYLFVEYPGYGGDPTPPNHERMRRVVDDVVAYLKDQGEIPVTLIGESIGSGVASWHVEQLPPEQLVLITPFTTLSDVAARQYWFYPTRWLVHEVYDVPAAVSDYQGRALVLHGTADRLIPTELGIEVYEALGDKKELALIENAGHNNLMLHAEARAALLNFLKAPATTTPDSRSYR